MSSPRRASDKYIRVRRTITNKELISIILLMSKENLINAGRQCQLLIEESAKREIEKRKNNRQ